MFTGFHGEVDVAIEQVTCPSVGNIERFFGGCITNTIKPKTIRDATLGQ